MARVRFIVTTKNNEAIIRKCLDAIFLQSYKDWECSLADDGSTDRTLGIVKKEYPQVSVYTKTGRGGPAYNRNVALFDAREDFLVFVDSDAIIAPNWLETAVKRIDRDPEIGVIGGKIYVWGSDIVTGPGYFYPAGTGYLVSAHENNGQNKFDKEEFCLWIGSSTFMVRTSVAKLIGGFDEEYCYLYEDLDICWRYWLAGYKVLYCPEAVSRHGFSVTSEREYLPSRISFMAKRNKMLTLYKNFQFGTLIKYSPLIILVALAELIFLSNRLAVLKGNLSVWHYRRFILQRRKEIKKIRKISDKYIMPFLERDHLKVISMCLGDAFKKLK